MADSSMGAATTKETNGSSAAEKIEKVAAIANPLAEKSSEVASNIAYHSRFAPHFSPLKFDPEQAFYATAESVRDSLIQVDF